MFQSLKQIWHKQKKLNDIKHWIIYKLRTNSLLKNLIYTQKSWDESPQTHSWLPPTTVNFLPSIYLKGEQKADVPCESNACPIIELLLPLNTFNLQRHHYTCKIAVVNRLLSDSKYCAPLCRPLFLSSLFTYNVYIIIYNVP